MRVVVVQRAELALYALALVAMASGCAQTEVFTKRPPVVVPSVEATHPGLIGVPAMTLVPTATTTARTRDPRPAAS